MKPTFAWSRFYLRNISAPHPALLHFPCDLPRLRSSSLSWAIITISSWGLHLHFPASSIFTEVWRHPTKPVTFLLWKKKAPTSNHDLQDQGHTLRHVSRPLAEHVPNARLPAQLPAWKAHSSSLAANSYSYAEARPKYPQLCEDCPDRPALTVLPLAP